jgi:membrane protein
MGESSADMLQSALQSAAGKKNGTIGTIIGIVTLLVTASGVFGEMQSALNAIWKTKPRGTTTSRLIRARAASLGLVAALGFLLIVSLVASAGITAFGEIATGYLPFGKLIVSALNVLVSFALLAILFAAIYKLLPDRKLEWRDVIVGACITSALFTIGKSLIGWYLGSSAVASAYGAAGALIIVLLWVYYSSEIFLLGAEFTRQYSLSRNPAPGAREAKTAARRPRHGAAHALESSNSEELANSPLLTAISAAVIALAFVRRLRNR